ncbi:CDP-diacylglycerol/glycerol-3-phosphate 3-phosphatidyltransferase [Chthoniobacter flavus Ellin428]|uniref:CDP-diacylglycerol--glycerol-3-phosphate 3-phosphatidyltransferase n=1 Tax=Chthoniobacter flavus Ellin428 TaxID=497964 RepID=B4DB26_9BACT|nr:CDP-diacylglycerol--glycerol-3-phosphate 3-phosphatidyltransferase [Chthoniobacter flavus]EDY16400.1 CDP-diacylglycerol/glycerol-3-phosphate 3-phosphatidyltransferase [Chthoniobacter flavus Ellin428]TCO92488.1 CDP-diacylglycerol--glycerol-3-phosphate 3-phosphatidyltransferase/cardiolipin synthase [Chthoniobacter flavus]
MNLPNRLTVARLYITAGFVASMTLAWNWKSPGGPDWRPFGLWTWSWSWGYTAGLIFFVAASITDYFDGSIARRRNLVTDFGKLMDPVADKVLMAAAFICLIPEHAIPAWAAIVIISREFLITGLRLLALSKGIILPADKMGKHKTVWQMVTVIYFLLLLSLSEFERAGFISGLFWWFHAWRYGGAVLIAAALILTLYSAFGYVWKNRELFAAA